MSDGRDFCPAGGALVFDDGLAKDRTVRECKLAAIALLGRIDVGAGNIFQDDQPHGVAFLSERAEYRARDVEWNGHHREACRISNALSVPVEHVVRLARRVK